MPLEHHRAFDRRQFVKQGVATGAGIVAANLSSRLWAQTRHEPVKLGFIGLGGRGRDLLWGFSDRSDCVVHSLCEVHEHRLNETAQTVKARLGQRPHLYTDIRQMLSDDQLEAVVVATPDHWHCLASAWACRAGKHVYVEKPLSHNLWEGRRLVEVAREYDRVVQVGLQNRSAPYNFAARDYIADGKLGRILTCNVYNQKDYGKCRLQADGDPPSHLDWEQWNGPCIHREFNSTRYERWHDFWRYSGGDVCNDGVHQMDLACMVLGIERLPQRVSSVGYLGEATDAEVPYVMVTNFEYEEFPLSFHLLLGSPYMLKTDPETRNSDMFPYWQQNATRIEIFGTEGVMFLGRHGGGWQVFTRPHSRQPVVKAQHFGRFPDPEHKADFLHAIREGHRPNGDVEHGHLSAALCHLANISFRVGNQQLTVDRDAERFIDHDEANALLRREYHAGYSLDADISVT